MNKTLAAPTSLVGAVKYFADKDIALTFLAGLRWPSGVVCPHCEAEDPMFLKTRRIWKCKACRKQFSVKVGTIFEDSAIGLDKWLPALWMLANSKNGISSYELARALGVTQKSAWFMLHRIRLAMQTKSFRKFDGHVEVDESFIGGKARNMHPEKRRRIFQQNEMSKQQSKVVVLGLLERHNLDMPRSPRISNVRLHIVPNTRRKTLRPIIDENVEPSAVVFTDENKSYHGLSRTYHHQVINHAERYADGIVHTNGLENFWSLLKRTIRGTYVSVEPFHLFRYLDEQAYRFNNRKTKDVARFINTVAGILGKRLTYNQLIGANLATT